MPDDTAKVRALVRLSVLQHQNEVGDALASARRALSLSERLRFRPGASEAYRVMGERYCDQAQHDSAQHCFGRAYDIALEMRDTPQMAMLQYDFGRLHNGTGALPQAVEALLRSLRLYEACCPETELVAVLRDLGLCYLRMRNLDAATPILERGKDICARHGVPATESVPVLTYLAQVYVFQGQAAKALGIVEEALAKAQAERQEHMLPMVLSFKGSALFDMGRYAEAAQAYETALAMPSAGSIARNVVILQNKLGNALLLDGQHAKAYRYLQQARQGAIAGGHTLSLNDNNAFLMHYFVRTAQPDSAHHYFEAYAGLRDSLETAAQREAVAEMQTLYETEKKDKALALQRAELADLRWRNALAWGIGAFALLLLAGLWWSFRNRRRRLEAERRAEAAEKDRLAQELESRNRELTTFTLQLAKRNELLQALQTEVSGIGEKARALNTMIRQNLNDEQDWQQFRQYFEQVHPDFWRNVQARFPELSNNDLRMLCLFRLNMSNKEIAAMLHYEPASVISARYRIRKKMNLPEDADFDQFVRAL